MVNISISTLIYKSTTYADWIYRNISKYTPKLDSGEAEFFFVANDPTNEVVSHLKKMKYNFVINTNNKLDDKKLYSYGYAKPEYISRVYRGYNEAIRRANGQIIVLVNSDMCFSEDWLENLLKYSDLNNVVSSKLVERNHPLFGVFPGAYEQYFGHDPISFNDQKFQEFVRHNKVTGLESGGAYMPCLFYKETAELVGLYPDGNIAKNSFEQVFQYGDQNFIARLNRIGVKHITSLDSIVYHFKEGEKENSVSSHSVYKARLKNLRMNNPRHAKKFIPSKFEKKILERWLIPDQKHFIIIKSLLVQEMSIEKTLGKLKLYAFYIKNYITKILKNI